MFFIIVFQNSRLLPKCLLSIRLSVPVWALCVSIPYLYCYYRHKSSEKQKNMIDARRPELHRSIRADMWTLCMLWLVILSCQSSQDPPQCFWSSDWLPCLSFWHLCCQSKHVHASPSPPALPESQKGDTSCNKHSLRREKCYWFKWNVRSACEYACIYFPAQQFGKSHAAVITGAQVSHVSVNDQEIQSWIVRV